MTESLPLMSDAELEAIAPSEPEDGLGALKTEKGLLPLAAVKVDAKVAGLFAETTLRQTFVNCHDELLEATYIFPLPDRAAVRAFSLRVGDRLIEGTVKERAQARQEYDEALAEGHRASIAEEERPGVFTLRVGNLAPGDEAEVTLEITGPLPYLDGEATYRFPLVVAPRYIPGFPLVVEPAGDGTALDTGAVPDASRITPPVLLPGFPNPVRLDLSVEIDPAGLPLSEIRSSLHTIDEEVPKASGGEVRRLRVRPGERLNRDFILRFRVGEEAVRTSLELRDDLEGDEGTFLLTLLPPLSSGRELPARDVVFVLDRSGSMGGWKMVAARRATGRMIDTLNERDRFTLLAFDTVVERPDAHRPGELVPATDRNRFRSVEFLATLDARGGTEMKQALEEAAGALALDRDPARDGILVLVTDGQVGNEDQILRSIGGKLAGMRVFTLGIDRAVNAGFLHRLAAVGGGGCELVESEDRLDEVMDSVHRQITPAVLTDVRLEGRGVELLESSFTPSRNPDLSAGAPLFLMGRYRGSGEGEVMIRGREDDAEWSQTISASTSAGVDLRSAWARGRIRDLEDRYAAERGVDNSLEDEIVETSVRFQVLSRFTAYLAVDTSETVDTENELHRVVQPVEAPEGWVMWRPVASLRASSSIVASRRPKQKQEASYLMLSPSFEADVDYDMDMAMEAPSSDLSEEEDREVFFDAADDDMPVAELDLTLYRRRARELCERLDAGEELSVIGSELRRMADELADAGA